MEYEGKQYKLLTKFLVLIFLMCYNFTKKAIEYVLKCHLE